MKPGITLLGLGPGDPEYLTRQAWTIIENASEIYLRTQYHPAVAGFPDSLQVRSFDALYEEHESFEMVYAQIVDQVLKLGQRPGGVIYAVPGHPFVAESTGPEIFRQAKSAGIPVSICEGVSFIEPVCTVLGMDPFMGLTLVDALDLVRLHHPPFPPHKSTLVAQIYDPYIASEVKLVLTNLFPDQHPVQLIHAAGTSDCVLEEIQLYQIDRSPHIGLMTVLYLPPLGEYTAFEGLQEIAAHLRAPEGCPWDREQTLETMRPHLMEETYEVLNAIDDGGAKDILTELGDLLLVIAMLMQIAAEDGIFTSADVIQAISSKLIHRHPHVFSNLQLDDTAAVLINWERLKAQERLENGDVEESLLDGVSITLPALSQAQEYQNRAARVGFDWPEIEGVLDKVLEEVDELRRTHDNDRRSAELGDLLFALVNLSRWYQIDAETALRLANARFQERFRFIEERVRSQDRELCDLSLDEMDALWNQAKEK
jgi:tetrapyrrole methylase family protein/MazG family protein